jgi:formamidopyrimidine-DNA glycosylase
MGPSPSAPITVSTRGARGGARAAQAVRGPARIAGGNIYADEALFRARLHPLRAAWSVGPREARRLHPALLETLRAGIDHEGSSIESFIDPAGERGSFQEILNVYQRTASLAGSAAPGRAVVVGAGTHYRPRCQPRRAVSRRSPALAADEAGRQARRAAAPARHMKGHP